ncbi:MAG TPA: ABC transporter permease, partial [Candidatus Sulfotelmatobacter sp.]|nr:ABC transporter permease [Candidatus Sulfotelmatobacter sp.]
MSTLLQDIRYAARQLRKSPGFAVLAIFTLAFGIGANTAMFTVVESVMLRPLPYQNADRLIYIGPAGEEGLAATSWVTYGDVRNQAQKIENVALFSEDVGVIRGHGESTSVLTPGVTPSLFKLLGGKPLLGRTFTEEEGQTGGPQVVLLSEGLWRQSFQADPEIAGKTVRVNGKPRTVVGVMPSDFRFPESMGQDLRKGLWLPIQATAEMQRDRGSHFFYIMAALKSGVTPSQEQAELDAIAQHIRQIDPKKGKEIAFRIESYHDMLTGPVRDVFLALVIALGLILFIACLNVANLLIARCLGRQQEFAVRSALGAGQLRLVRQLFVEGGLLSVLGCLVGFGLAWLAIQAVQKLPQDTLPRSEEIAVHWSVVLALAGIATITTVLSSLLPALFAARTDPQPALQASSRGVGPRSMGARVSSWLVAAEVAISAVLLIATGLLFHTLWNLEHTKLGFDVTRVTTFTAMPADAAGFANMAVSKTTEKSPTSIATLFYQPTLERIRQLPGVQDAALMTAPPLSGINMNTSFKIMGRAEDPNHAPQARLSAVSGGYERLMGTPVVRGRMISNDDGPNAPYVVAINETLAHKYFSGQDPLGQQIELGGKDTGAVKPYTIVGVIGDQVDSSVGQPPRALLMVPHEQVPASSLYYQLLVKTLVFFMVKTRGEIAVAPAMKSVFAQTAPDFALDNFETMQSIVDQSNFNQRLGLYLTGAFAGMAELMVVAGLYGVLAQLVSYRRREIGVRMALGATRERILRMFLRKGAVLVIAGLVLGTSVALWASRLVKSFLYQVKPLDGVTYAGVIVILLVVGILAALL